MFTAPARLALAAVLAVSFAPLAGCEAPPPEPVPETKAAASAKPADARTASSKTRAPKEKTKRKIAAKPAIEVAASPDDPQKGKWTLEDATKDLPGEGPPLVFGDLRRRIRHGDSGHRMAAVVEHRSGADLNAGSLVWLACNPTNLRLFTKSGDRLR